MSIRTATGGDWTRDERPLPPSELRALEAAKLAADAARARTRRRRSTEPPRACVYRGVCPVCRREVSTANEPPTDSWGRVFHVRCWEGRSVG